MPWVGPEWRARYDTAADWAVDIVECWHGRSVVGADMGHHTAT